MSELWAMAVHGDAFVHQRSNGTILVDGGGSASSLATSLTRDLPKLNHLDVVVCTHADLDHANGLQDILTHWKVARKGPASIGELWLPGRWMETAKQGLTDPTALMNKLIHALDSGTLPIEKALVWEELADRNERRASISQNRAAQLGSLLRDLRAKIDMPQNRSQQARSDAAAVPKTGSDLPLVIGDEANTRPSDPFEPEWVAGMRARGEAPVGHDKAARAIWQARRRVVYRIGGQPHMLTRGLPATVGVAEPLGRYCLALIDAAQAIIEIARHGIESKIPIRWFDYEAFERNGKASGGRPGFLLPMNSVEIRSPPVATAPNVITHLSLSKANRESLVFYAPAEPGCRGVVFCADSRLGYGWGGRTPFQAYKSMATSQQVGTAPHHGAQSADVAYSHATRFGIDRWVCAGNGRTKPGPGFRAIVPGHRCCTQCPFAGTARATVRIKLDPAESPIPGCCRC